MNVLEDIADLFDIAGATGGPFSIAIASHRGAIATHAGGFWPSGRATQPDDRFYAASLAKQITGAALALLVKEGCLDPTMPVADILPHAGDWAKTVRPLDLIGHMSGLPGQGTLEAKLASGDWTDERVMAALQSTTASPAPGMEHRYSNAGYVVLARIIEAVTGTKFPDFVESRLTTPLGLESIGFSSTVGQPSSEHWGLLGSSLPLSMGDGGLWTSAKDFACWLDFQNQDGLGIADLVSLPARLADGQEVDYGWGIGLRGQPRGAVLLHGGDWIGASARSIRCPDFAFALVVLAAGAAAPSAAGLADAIFKRMQSAGLA